MLQQAITGLGPTQPAPRLYADVLAGGRLGNATVERSEPRSAAPSD
ncbi:hypothetical protein [Cryptosporangium phraense]|nr:hypothetical protein [Cryptosporangium phraense]